MKLLSISDDAKTKKGEKFGYLTGVLYMAPNSIGGPNVCPMASPGCIESCLYSAGRGRFNNVQQARINRKLLYFDDRSYFYTKLRYEIETLIRDARQQDKLPALRLNGTSDLLPDGYLQIMRDYPDVLFYDYTKVFNRLYKKLPDNYHLTFSKSENNGDLCIKALHDGHNVAAVFAAKDLPKFWHSFPVIDGDKSDTRFLDDKGVVVGLRAKGDARNDTSGFVIR